MLLYQWLTTVASDRGSEKALVYRDTYLSWRGLLHRVDRRAQELSSMGIGEGAWVGLMLGNVPDFVILCLALAKIGAVAVPLDPTTGARELEMILEAAPLRGLITRPRGSEGAPSATGGSGSGPVQPSTMRSSLSTPIQSTPPSKFVAESRRRLQGTLLTCGLYRRMPAPGFKERGAMTVHFTATVGGDPHGIVRTEANLAAIADIVGKSLDVKPTDRLLVAVALHHSYGFDLGFVPSLAFGATLFLEDEISAKRLAKLLRDHDVDIFPATPALYGGLVRVPTSRPLKIPGARYLSSGSVLPGSIAEGFHARYGVRPLSLYHSTQAGPIAIDRMGKEPESVGRAMEGVELRVTGPAGGKAPTLAPGSLWARSKALSTLAVPKIRLPTPEDGDVAVGGVDREGWFRTGDLAAADRNGRVTLVGREDDLVKVDGKRMALSEVVGCLETFPKVKAAKVRVVTDDLGGPMVVAQVVRTGTCKAEELIDHCAKNLAPYKVPRQIEFCEQV